MIGVLLYADMTGNEKKKVIAHREGKQHTSFKNVNSLPIRFAGKRKACMTSEIFRE